MWHTHLYQKKYREAEKIFSEIISKANEKQPREPALDKLKELALISLGKSKFEQKMYQGAIRNFTEAGEMKMERGDTAGFSKCENSKKIAQDKINEAIGVKAEVIEDNYIDPLLSVISDDEE